MAKNQKDKTFENLPACAAEYIEFVIRKMGYRRKARKEVAEELTDHFEEHLRDSSSSEEKEQKAQQLIAEFGDAKLLGRLMRRAKKRCRPLWQKVLVRGLAAALVIFTYLVICDSWLRMGNPTIRINYAQWLTDQTSQGRDESLNARADIEKAAVLASRADQYRKMIWPEDMNDAQREATDQFLQNNAVALDTLYKAIEKPYYWSDYNSSGEIVTEVNSILIVNPNFMDNLMRPLGPYRKVARLLASRIGWRAYLGDINGALNDEISLFKLGQLLQGKGLLIEQLVGIAVEALAHQRLMYILDRTDVPAEQLQQLQDELARIFAHKQPIDLNCEKAFRYAIIQKGFTDNGKGNGKILKVAAPYFVRDWKDAVWSSLAFSYPNRQQALAEVEKMFAQAQQDLQTTPWQRKNESPGKSAAFVNAPFMFNIQALAIEKIALISWRLRTDRAATLTILAVLRFQKETSEFPENLNKLVQNGYLNELPQDPFSNGPLNYRKTKDGFILYSWGSDLEDDGGWMPRNEKGYLMKYSDEGDWVFWPVEKN